MGTYANDAAFLKQHGIGYKELVSADGQSKVMVIPAWQGRVMTTSATGDEGDSYGWINYRFIQDGKVNPQIQPVGGEERFWLGPEGGPFSLYFAPGKEQVYANWAVPAVLDTEGFAVEAHTEAAIRLSQKACLTNASGTVLHMDMERNVTLMNDEEIGRELGICLPEGLKRVAYRTDNRIVNTGTEAWTRATGLVSVWMLGCFNPTPSTTVFIPYHTEGTGRVVNDTYFGKIPADRLVVDDKLIYFKIDGKFRSKLGLPAGRSLNLCGSYDSEKGVLTILWCNRPERPCVYVNGQWGPQENPFDGDVINAYNDGPLEDNSIMGPFYEIETSSPGAELAPGEGLTHTQAVVHLQGNDKMLAPIVQQVFKTDLEVIKRVFR